MQLKFFSIPVADPGELEEEANRFLRGHRVLSVQRQLVQDAGSAYWALCIEYLEGITTAKEFGGKNSGKQRVDYREVLDPEVFDVFSKLRERRKELAERDAVPVYAVCTNEQLAEMAKKKVTSKAGLLEIEGFGEAKAAKYGDSLLAVLTTRNGAKAVEAGQATD